MGYGTDYKLHAVTRDGKPHILPKSLVISRHDDFHRPDDYRAESSDKWKWYAHEDDCRELSRRHPALVFILDGEGEDQGDVWRKFFHDGRLYVWRPTPQTPPDLNPEIMAVLRS